VPSENKQLVFPSTNFVQTEDISDEWEKWSNRTYVIAIRMNKTSMYLST